MLNKFKGNKNTYEEEEITLGKMKEERDKKKQGKLIGKKRKSSKIQKTFFQEVLDQIYKEKKYTRSEVNTVINSKGKKIEEFQRNFLVAAAENIFRNRNLHCPRELFPRPAYAYLLDTNLLLKGSSNDSLFLEALLKTTVRKKPQFSKEILIDVQIASLLRKSNPSSEVFQGYVEDYNPKIFLLCADKKTLESFRVGIAPLVNSICDDNVKTNEQYKYEVFDFKITKGDLQGDYYYIVSNDFIFIREKKIKSQDLLKAIKDAKYIVYKDGTLSVDIKTIKTRKANYEYIDETIRPVDTGCSYCISNDNVFKTSALFTVEIPYEAILEYFNKVVADSKNVIELGTFNLTDINKMKPYGEIEGNNNLWTIYNYKDFVRFLDYARLVVRVQEKTQYVEKFLEELKKIVDFYNENKAFIDAWCKNQIAFEKCCVNYVKTFESRIRIDKCSSVLKTIKEVEDVQREIMNDSFYGTFVVFQRKYAKISSYMSNLFDELPYKVMKTMILTLQSILDLKGPEAVEAVRYTAVSIFNLYADGSLPCFPRIKSPAKFLGNLKGEIADKELDLLKTNIIEVTELLRGKEQKIAQSSKKIMDMFKNMPSYMTLFVKKLAEQSGLPPEYAKAYGRIVIEYLQKYPEGVLANEVRNYIIRMVLDLGKDFTSPNFKIEFNDSLGVLAKLKRKIAQLGELENLQRSKLLTDLLIEKNEAQQKIERQLNDMNKVSSRVSSSPATDMIIQRSLLDASGYLGYSKDEQRKMLESLGGGKLGLPTIKEEEEEIISTKQTDVPVPQVKNDILGESQRAYEQIMQQNREQIINPVNVVEKKDEDIEMSGDINVQSNQQKESNIINEKDELKSEKTTIKTVQNKNQYNVTSNGQTVSLDGDDYMAFRILQVYGKTSPAMLVKQGYQTNLLPLLPTVASNQIDEDVIKTVWGRIGKQDKARLLKITKVPNSQYSEWHKLMTELPVG